MTKPSYENSIDASLEQLVRRYCQLPEPLLCAEELERWEHKDLASRDLSSLVRELEAFKLWMPVSRPRHQWYRERVRQLREAIRCAS